LAIAQDVQSSRETAKTASQESQRVPRQGWIGGDGPWTG